MPVHSLAGGDQIRVRQLEPSDREVVAAIFAGLGDLSRRHRFGGPKPRLSEAELAQLTAIDHRDHEALVAFDSDGRPIGVARFVRDRADERLAEIAFAVVDDWHRQGVGTLLTRLLTRRARSVGIDRFVGLTVSANQPALALIRNRGRVVDHSSGGGMIELVVDLRAAA